MNNASTLIAYQTKTLATQVNANLIAEVLRNNFGMNVDIVNLKVNSKPKIEEYQNVIVGSGIRMGMWYGRAKKFLKNKFHNKNLAIFISSGTAGENKQEAIEKYINKLLEKRIYLKPFAVEAFGGWYKKDGVITENWHDPEKVKEWANILGSKLSAI